MINLLCFLCPHCKKQIKTPKKTLFFKLVYSGGKKKKISAWIIYLLLCYFGAVTIAEYGKSFPLAKVKKKTYENTVKSLTFLCSPSYFSKQYSWMDWSVFQVESGKVSKCVKLVYILCDYCLLEQGCEPGMGFPLDVR